MAVSAPASQLWTPITDGPTSIIIATPRPETKRQPAGSAIDFFEPQKCYTTKEGDKSHRQLWNTGCGSSDNCMGGVPTRHRDWLSLGLRWAVFKSASFPRWTCRDQAPKTQHSAAQHNTHSLLHWVKRGLPAPSSRTFLP